VPHIPVTPLGRFKTIDFNHINGRLRKSNIKWKGAPGDEWVIYFIIYPKTKQESVAGYSMSDHLNDDFDKRDRPPSLLTPSNAMTSKMDSRNDQFTSTLRLLNRVLDTASTGL
jgi:hypothetical protein